jgi:hypothetical protein
MVVFNTETMARIKDIKKEFLQTKRLEKNEPCSNSKLPIKLDSFLRKHKTQFEAVYNEKKKHSSRKSSNMEFPVISDLRFVKGGKGSKKLSSERGKQRMCKELLWRNMFMMTERQNDIQQSEHKEAILFHKMNIASFNEKLEQSCAKETSFFEENDIQEEYNPLSAPNSSLTSFKSSVDTSLLSSDTCNFDNNSCGGIRDFSEVTQNELLKRTPPLSPELSLSSEDSLDDSSNVQNIRLLAFNKSEEDDTQCHASKYNQISTTRPPRSFFDFTERLVPENVGHSASFKKLEQPAFGTPIMNSERREFSFNFSEGIVSSKQKDNFLLHGKFTHSM